MRANAIGGRLLLPHALLTGWFVLASAQLLLNALRPPLPTTNVAALKLFCILALCLALVTVAAGFFRRDESVLVALVVAALALMTAVTVMAASGQGQIMAGLYFMLLGLIAALSVSRRAVVAILVVGVVGYETGVLVNRVLDSPGYAVFVGILIVVVTLVVSGLVTSLREQAIHDQLTGALNRRGLEQAARLAHGLASREGKGTAIVEVDLDGFKEYNDEFGHAAGDDRLAQLASDWRGVLRRTDLLARIGGDEFVIVLPGASADEAAEFVGRLRAVNNVPWTAGVATWDAGEPLAEAFSRADAQMYDGKRPRPGREMPGVN